MRRRGQTVYLPDGSVPLHPPVLSEDAASLLPDGPRAAVLWTIDLDPAGEPSAVDVRRAVVRSRARLDYAGVQADHDAGRLHPAIAALPELGRLRRALAVRRGAIELELPEQEVVPAPDGGWTVQVRAPARRRGLERGDLAAHRDGRGPDHARRRGRGCCARCPRRSRPRWPSCGAPPNGWASPGPTAPTAAEVLAGLPLDTPHALALRRAATTLLRGAGYAGFDPRPAPHHPPTRGTAGSAPRTRTSPRRCGGWSTVSRTEVCLALAAGRELPAPLRAALPTLPELMAASDAVAGKVTRACVDRTEAALLADRVGDELAGRGAAPERSARASRARSTCRNRRCSPAAPAGCRPARRSGPG